MRKIYLSLFFIAFSVAVKAQLIAELTANPGTTANLPFGTSNYAVNESIFTEIEMGGPAAFTTAATAITSVGINTATVGATTTFGTVRIYFKDVPLATTTLATGTYTTAGYTLVYNGSVAVTATGWTEITLATPYVRATGTNLEMLIERADGVTHTSYVWNCAQGNNVSATALTTRRYNSTVALSGTTSLLASTFRPAMRFIHRYTNDVKSNVIYTLGKLPLPNGSPNTISANITNEGFSTQTSVNVTLTITGANSFTNTKTIASLASLTSTNVVFDPFTPTVAGNNTVTVSVTADDYAPNNSASMTQVVNANTWSYAYGSTAAGGVGFNGATGDFVAKFNTNLATALAQVSVNFFAGGQPYKIGIWDATGVGGTPGALLWESTSQVAAAGVNVLPVSPAVALTAGNFFVGVRQTGTTNVSFAYQVETPIRASTFYFTSPTGGTTWNDFSPANSFRFMIEPKLILPVDAGVSNLTPPANITCYATTQNVTALLSNTGANAIAPGAAAVTLKVRGANTYTNTITNTTNIASGGSETITFTGVNFSNGGTNFDTVYVDLAGDPEKTNDTTRTTNISASTISSLPLDETFEPATLNFGYISIVAGARNLTTLQTGNYTNVDLGGTLSPHGGTKMIVFDNYSGASSVGVINRLFSNCISVPASGAGICNYNLSFWMSHDASFNTDLDSLYITVSNNGGVTWNRILPGFGRIDAGFAVPGWKKETVSLAAYAGQTIQLGFEDVSKYGNIIALDDINVGSEATQNVTLNSAINNGISLQKGCDDQGWTYYVDPANPGQYLFGIQWDPGNTGANPTAKTNALPSIQLDGADFASENIPAGKATYTMKRYWNVNLNGGVMTAPVNVRFFYTAAEKTAVDNAAAAFALANSATVEPPTWFKTVSGAFAGDGAHVNPDGVINAAGLTNANGAGNTLNGVLYAQFNGVTSFSGGTYSAGVGTGNTLPSSLITFAGEREGAVNRLRWTTATEQNNRGFEVQRSTDGINYSALGFVNSRALGGNSTDALSYSFIDNNPAGTKQYYRLRQLDIDNHSKFSNVVLIKGEKPLTLSIEGLFPNPANTNVNVLIGAPVRDKVTLMVVDMTGKTVLQQIVNVEAGSNTIPVDISRITNGNYFVKLVCSSNCETAVSKFVKQ